MTGFDEKTFISEMSKQREQEFLKRVRDYDERIAPTMRQHGYQRIDRSERTVLFTFGEVTISR
ncbi:ISLre2 family transposase, partial [Streptococcus iniae]